MLDIILDTVIDGLKILPFLWIAFFLIEFLEHRYNAKTVQVVEKSGRLGPLLGGLVGCFPQCGFSVMATNLYVTRIITLGTLISVYLSTSDEMLPILLAHKCSFQLIAVILLIKLTIAVVSGFIIDLMMKKKPSIHSSEFCEGTHCDCEKGLLHSSFKHTFQTLVFIMGVSFLLNIVVFYGKTDFLSHLFKKNSLLSPFLASLIGLFPNCAASVVITELYFNQVLSFSSLIAGLLTGSGVALLVLFRSNHNWKENVGILLLIYLIGSVSGVLLESLSYLF